MVPRAPSTTRVSEDNFTNIKYACGSGSNANKCQFLRYIHYNTTIYKILPFQESKYMRVYNIDM